MKTHRHTTRLQRLAGATLIAALAAGLGTTALGSGGSASGIGGDGIGGDDGAGNGGIQLLSEAIGSLPGFWVDDEATLVKLPAELDESQQFDMHLEILVPDKKLHDLFASAAGQGYALLSLPPTDPGMTRVRIYGDVDVSLLRTELQKAQPEIAIQYGAENIDALATILWNGAVISQYGVNTAVEALSVPVNTHGFLSTVVDTPAKLYLYSPTSGLSKALISGGGGTVDFSLVDL
ncbi:hypothetical protein [Engelhardtia mirabilis]|uniref:Uncharacterized protein n=1 Tax=Engelhardtia mirabilis TaxID=2528011 RepID=A0A518BQG1_9BACT|nr:hypothetical protein Pla133_43310 [Planctomycetes bacterium Pla133]QDV03541.1 hypothetical protein Pla86_43300 [Planctomycetes bacterium Pla86]